MDYKGLTTYYQLSSETSLSFFRYCYILENSITLLTSTEAIYQFVFWDNLSTFDIRWDHNSKLKVMDFTNEQLIQYFDKKCFVIFYYLIDLFLLNNSNLTFELAHLMHSLR
ncbi:hypothetical protein ACTFIR_012830 [Dictyostelium discoideum]